VGVHAAVNEANAKSPGGEFLNRIVQRILELSEQEELLVGILEESLSLQQVVQTRQFGITFLFLDAR
jgi:hypothetical protein